MEPQSHRGRCGTVQLLVVARIVGEADLYLDGLARVGGNKGVRGSGCPVDLGVVGEPPVGEGRAVPAVVGYAGGVGGEGLPHLGGAADGGSARGRGVRPRNDQHKPTGQLPAVVRANGAFRRAVRGDREHDGHRAVPVRRNVDLPADVLALLQPPRIPTSPLVTVKARSRIIL